MGDVGGEHSQIGCGTAIQDGAVLLSTKVITNPQFTDGQLRCLPDDWKMILALKTK
jgi:hypothetical protein